jgi:hypothetical protein
VALWVASYAVITIGTIPVGCFEYKTIHKPDWCYDVANFSAFVIAGVGSSAAVAGMSVLLKGDSDPRGSLIAGLVGGISLGTAYLLGDNPKELKSLTNFQGNDARVHRLAFMAVPALAVVTYELSALLSPRRPALVTPAVVPTAGGSVLLLSGSF